MKAKIKMNYCIYCGTKISADNKFCPQCGKPIFGHPVNTDQEPEEETDKELDSPIELESAPISVEEPVQSEGYTAETVKTPDCVPENDTKETQSGKNRTLSIVLCSIAAVLVVLLVVVLVVKNSKITIIKYNNIIDIIMYFISNIY